MEDEGSLRLQSVREGRLLVGPETLQINLQNACELDCLFCWNHSPLRPRPSARWLAERLSPSHLARLLEDLRQLRPGRVLLSGRGEPLLHPGARELLHALARLGIPATIQTNGVGGLAPEELLELGVRRLMVNLSAATPAGYEQVHPGRGPLLSRVLERLRQLGRAGPAGPEVVLVAVIQQSNQAELVALVELAAELGSRGVMFKGLEVAPGLEPLLLDPAARAFVRRQLDAASVRGGLLGVAVDDVHLRQVLDQGQATPDFTPSLAAGPCYMGWYYLRVTSAGEVMYCCKDKRMGHLDDRSLYEIWRSPIYHLQRLAGRDGETDAGFFGAKCRTCSNFARNDQIRRLLEGGSRVEGGASV